jgi:hypothetical protein
MSVRMYCLCISIRTVDMGYWSQHVISLIHELPLQLSCGLIGNWQFVFKRIRLEILYRHTPSVHLFRLQWICYAEAYLLSTAHTVNIACSELGIFCQSYNAYGLPVKYIRTLWKKWRFSVINSSFCYRLFALTRLWRMCSRIHGTINCTCLHACPLLRKRT